ncbi:hypothetical protein [Alkalibacterium pelagium]|uniref:Uncharacterized protein n=1 Tax=Alkalibacterium pelagium TaxID=426702 RepID=A0A1H7IM97_9LACT|nr:hypothetical protein [Alkalibacterium pelagium]SEK63566.1 hypothetical protein SAMN04488099_104190 [Alkalibacterium pelagium]
MQPEHSNNKVSSTLLRLILFGFLLVNIYVMATTKSNIALGLAGLSFVLISGLLLVPLITESRK